MNEHERCAGPAPTVHHHAARRAFVRDPEGNPLVLVQQ